MTAGKDVGPRDAGDDGAPRRADSPSDAAIRSMLTARADRTGSPSLDLASIVAAAGARARGGRSWVPMAQRLLPAATALAAVAITGVLVAGQIVSRPVGTAAPGGTGTVLGGTAGPSADPVPPASEAVASALPDQPALLPAQFGDLVRTRSAELAGTVVAVRGRLEIDPSPCLQRGGICANTLLLDAGGGFHVRPTGDIGPGPWDGSGPITGTFALRLTAALQDGQPVVEDIGTLTTPTDDRLTDGRIAWSADEISAGAAHVQGALAAVRGWLVRTPLHPCASILHPPGYIDNGLTFGCPDDDYLTASRYQPMQPDGSSIGAPNAIELPAGSYDSWAPDRAPFGRDSVGVEPREATYLLQLVLDDHCGPTDLCIVGPENLRWRIVGRLDSIVDPATASPTPRPSAETGLVPWTVGEIATAEATDPFALADGRLLAVRGWLIATPALRCRSQPMPSGTPSWGCDEIDWLTEDSFQPWASDGSGASVRAPMVGLRVQNGAYAAFALPSGTGGVPGGGLTPSLATFLVRGSVHDGCETLPAPSDPSAAPCAGPAIVLWEIVGRQPSTTVFFPPFPMPSLKPGETPVPGTDGSGDTPCLPAGQPCG
jgi:hypothetical protein